MSPSLPPPHDSVRRPGGRLGRFQILGELGHGAMGVVYRGYDAEAEREVAIKVLVDPEKNPGRLERFRREARLTAALDHPGIVHLHDFGDEDGTPFIVYELVEGGRTFDEVMPVLDLADRCALIRDAARAGVRARGGRRPPRREGRVRVPG